MNKVVKFFGVVFLFSACSVAGRRGLKTSDRPYLMRDKKISQIRYDTIDASFLHELFVESYIVGGDGVSKAGQYVIAANDVKKTYKDGYYIISEYFLKEFSMRNPSLRIDSASITNFLNSQYKYNIYNETRGFEIEDLCGVRFQKIDIKIVAVYVGKVSQKTPLFLNCSDRKRFLQTRTHRIYNSTALPTYLVVNVLKYNFP